MIVFNDYNLSSFEDKIKHLQQYGRLLSHRVNEEYVMELYSLGSIFVEVGLGFKDNNIIIYLKSFKDMNTLDPYINDISLEELY